MTNAIFAFNFVVALHHFMSIARKVRQVEQLFGRLEKEINSFKSHSNLQCVAGCGKCCTKPDIDASPLEFLPWAYQLFLNGEAEKYLNELNQSDLSICKIYQPLSLLDNYKGSCSNYKYRGLICRLFGYGASKDKYGKLRLVTCSIIKEDQHDIYNNAVVAINDGMKIPLFSDYYMKLSQIDVDLGNRIVPINKALKLAIEAVLSYYAYRPFPKKLPKSA